MDMNRCARLLLAEDCFSSEEKARLVARVWEQMVVHSNGRNAPTEHRLELREKVFADVLATMRFEYVKTMDLREKSCGEARQ